jgi:hypothetical protein
VASDSDDAPLIILEKGSRISEAHARRLEFFRPRVPATDQLTAGAIEQLPAEFRWPA